jgi:ferredoxin
VREHVIYYFSGTGNSLKAALTIQKALGNCDVVSMGAAAGSTASDSSSSNISPPGKVRSIGFVFPCYFGGVPHRVLDCIAGMNFSPSESAMRESTILSSAAQEHATQEPAAQEQPYVYAVVTYGALIGTALGQLGRALQNRGVTLAYAAALKAFSNYVILYDMSKSVAEKTAQTKAELQPIIADILGRKSDRVKRPSLLISAYNHLASRNVATRDRRFIVRESCNSCGICEQVCPVRNIRLQTGTPHWLDHCEQCLACVHWCPRRAIDYGDKTRKRGRYTNPEITSKMFIDYLNGAGIDSKKA